MEQTLEKAELISGKGLYWSLLIVLSAVVLASDYLAGRFANPLLSISLGFGSTAIAVGLLGLWVVPLLRRLKTGQVIREDGPQSHLKKAGTPTMGGIFFAPIAIIFSLGLTALAQQLTPALLAVALLTLALGAVGWVDDLQVLLKKSNTGISARLRLGIELSCGAILAIWLLNSAPQITTLQFPFGLTLSIGVLFVALAMFVVAAESNAVNLTDGMDGLAAGTSAIALIGLALVIAPTYPALMVFCACMSGGCVGFLAHNHNPARVFMGDTGSLALGAALAGVGLISNSLWALFILSGLFLVESLSVIAQVLYYKATKDESGVGKRLFKMSPIHHHFEQSGWPETRVVGMFYGCVVLLTLLTLGLNTF